MKIYGRKEQEEQKKSKKLVAPKTRQKLVTINPSPSKASKTAADARRQRNNYAELERTIVTLHSEYDAVIIASTHQGI